VSKLPNGQYFMSYEYCGAPEGESGYAWGWVAFRC
jgi:hypothetical protein